MDAGVRDRPNVKGINCRICVRMRRTVNVVDSLGKGIPIPADGPVSRQNRMEAVYGGYGPQRNEGDPGDV